MKEKIKNNREIIKKIKPFWERYWKLERKFFNKVFKLEKEMNKKAKLGFELEFFPCDGEVVGVGVRDFKDRKKFPLLQDRELNN